MRDTLILKDTPSDKDTASILHQTFTQIGYFLNVGLIIKLLPYLYLLFTLSMLKLVPLKQHQIKLTMKILKAKKSEENDYIMIYCP